MSLKAKDMNLLRSTMRAMDKLQTAWEQNDEAGIDKSPRNKSRYPHRG